MGRQNCGCICCCIAPRIMSSGLFLYFGLFTYQAGDSGMDYDATDISPSVRNGMALYEAARALIGYITPNFDEVQRVSCMMCKSLIVLRTVGLIYGDGAHSNNARYPSVRMAWPVHRHTFFPWRSTWKLGLPTATTWRQRLYVMVFDSSL